MPVFLDTRGHSTLAIGICGRCSIKYPLDELHPDPNYPGLFVCDYDRDDFDPWRLTPRPTENITLQNPRPDVSVAITPGSSVSLGPLGSLQAMIASGQGLNPLGPDESSGLSLGPVVSSLGQPGTWAASSSYSAGNTVLVTLVSQPTLFICLVPGTSGASEPAWPAGQSATVTDNAVIWFNAGSYLG